MNKGEKTKSRILDAAKSLFSENGYTAVTMTAIKGSTGLSIGGVYKYFKSTKEIYIAILARDEESAKTDADPTSGMTGEQILKYSFDRNYELASKQQLGWVVSMYEFMLCESDYMSVMQERFNSGIDFCKRMIAADRPDLSDADLRQLALLVVNYLNGLQLNAVVHAFTKEDMAEQLKLLRHLLFDAEIDLEAKEK